MASRLENILGIGLMVMMGCNKSPSSSTEKASDLYNEYQASVGKEETREEAEKNIAALMERFFNTSKTRDFDTFWDCQAGNVKSAWMDRSLGYSQYSNKWTHWVYGNPEIKRIKSISLSNDLRSGDIKIEYSKSYPYLGKRDEYPDAEFGVKRENGRWVFNYEDQGQGNIIERFEPKTLENLPRIQVYPK